MKENQEKKPKKARRYYDEAFKKAAVEHCQRNDGDVSGTASELGINYWTLRDWVDGARAARNHAAGASDLRARSTTELESENRALKAELARVREQRDILKKSLGILSNP